MRLHQFEIFYYVVQHGGIAAAARAIPWRISMSAVSKQVAAMERDYGGRLFKRRPFEPTPLGRRLFEGGAPLYQNLLTLAAQANRATAPVLRLGASEFVLREYVTPTIETLLERHPELKIDTKVLGGAEIEHALQSGRIDLGLVTADVKPQTFAWRPLRELPLVLVTPRRHPQPDAAAYWAQRPITQPLVTPPAGEAIARCFNRGLRARNIFWPVTVEVGSAALVPITAVSYNAVGVTAGVPSLLRDAPVRVLALAGFAPVVMGARWRGELTPPQRLLLELLTEVAVSTKIPVPSVRARGKSAPSSVASTDEKKPSRSKRAAPASAATRGRG